jgi:hypothetical protein
VDVFAVSYDECLVQRRDDGMVMSSPRCSISCNLSAASHIGRVLQNVAAAAPSVTFCDTSANMRKNLVSCGIRRS